jgi:hypothetical protein
MISKADVKRTFKIFLDSNDTESFTGPSIFKANYTVDLTTIIFDDKDFDKQYYMYMSFVSDANTITNSSIDYAHVYTLHVDMGRGINVYEHRNTKSPSFILQVEALPPIATATAGTVLTRFNSTDDMSKPTLIQNIRNINNIALNVIKANTNTTFSQATITNYICVLTFVEA